MSDCEIGTPFHVRGDDHQQPRSVQPQHAVARARNTDPNFVDA
jgi:hypothetical protein